MEVQSPGPTTNINPQTTSTSCAIPASSTEVSSTSPITNITAPINLENLDKECSALAGLFQQTVNDMKVRLCFYSFSIIVAIKVFHDVIRILLLRKFNEC